jgi:hypothetical protein
MSRIVLHVDALLLRGVRRQDRAAVAEAIRGELARVLQGPGMAARLRQRALVDRLHVPAVRIAAGGAPAMGRAVARGIGRGLTS